MSLDLGNAENDSTCERTGGDQQTAFMQQMGSMGPMNEDLAMENYLARTL